MNDRKYWVRTEHGKVWGPYTVAALERLRGQLTENCQASTDGEEWLPGADFPELRGLLVPAKKVERQTGMPPVTPRITRAMAEAFGVSDVTVPVAPTASQPDGAVEERAPSPLSAPAPEASPPPPVAKPKPPPPPPPPPVLEELPPSADLAQASPARLYALAVATSATGALQFELDKGKTLRIAFRRGAPEHFTSSDPELSLIRFLQAKKLLAAEKALEAEEQARKSGQDVLSVLFQLQLIPPADAVRLIGEYSAFLLDRAMVCWRGKFSFEKDAPPPPGAFPLGSRWGMLVDSVRRIEVPLLRARLGKRLLVPVVRSGGMAAGKVEELPLNAQEARIYADIDGTKTGDEVLRAHESATALHVLYLLTELGHLSFAGGLEEKDVPAAAAAPPPPPPPPQGQKPAQAPPPAAARALPKTTREPPRPAAAPAPARPAAPPVMKPVAPAAPPRPAAPAAPAVSRPPPTFAQPPADESLDAQKVRLGQLWERLAGVDHFQALGMERKSASAAEAKRNFFVLAKELHPDTVTDPAQADLKELKERLFARINEAAQVLGDDKRRKEYEGELDGKADTVDVSRIFAAEENFQRAEIFIKAHKYQEGLDLLEQAMQMNPDEAEFYAWRGYAKFLMSKDRKGSFEACAGDCRKAMKMVERCLPAHLFLGHMAKMTGDLKLARKCYTKVLELDEKHVDAQRELRLMGSKGS
ncbi:MAG TPA: DnaJ domain-containing protein [Myxococcales bacterium]|nr:DnaJ domain-containing protein [Myxococcales bacterium]